MGLNKKEWTEILAGETTVDYGKILEEKHKSLQSMELYCKNTLPDNKILEAMNSLREKIIKISKLI